MRLLVLIWGCLVLPGYEALEGPKEISRFEGDTVSLRCTYREELRDHRKYWCRKGGLLFPRCSGTIYAGKEGQETTEGRVSIHDNRQELSLIVTLWNLTLQDAGKYWCGVEKRGPDESLLISLFVFPGPCCPPSPSPTFQLLATTRLQPKAKTQQTQPPGLTSPGLYPAGTTAKQGKTGAEATPFPGTSRYGHKRTSQYAATSPHAATSPPAGSSRPPKQLDSTSAEDASPALSSGSSKPRVSIPMVRILAPVLVLLSLLSAAGLIAFSSHLLLWRKEARQDMETQRNEKVYLSHLPLGNGRDTEDAVINIAGSMGPLTIPEPSPGLHTEIQYLSQTTEEEEAPSQAPEGDVISMPPLHTSEEELGFSKFVSV
ncbi:CMRF35-like molecule 9 isoform X6 [Macaca mulatta]|uniref:CD300 molecule like family member g n=1 Tax=Macaca mulatta TaxID=9544 RepID=A0A1D5QJD5_MACMU|nr:CMRF35-like molecule 9 isoform X7 [Macaca mulatta]